MVKLTAKTANIKKTKKRKNSTSNEEAATVEVKEKITKESTESKVYEFAAPVQKHKNKVKSKNKAKHSKSTKTTTADVNETQTAAIHSDNDEEDLIVKKKDNVDLHQPTLAELRESEKPENINAIVTVRQKKKQKHEARLLTQQTQTGDKEKQRNEQYLHKWKNAHSEWKFEKLRQISIQQTALDAQKIDDNFWPIALEYLSGTKGVAKTKIMEMAEKAIDELDKECTAAADEAKRKTILKSTRYCRARELLQSFD